MGRIWVRLLASATFALCLGACATSGASVASANGGRSIAQAPSIELGATTHGRLYDGAFYSGYSVAYWVASLLEGDRIVIRTAASGRATPPCQMLYLPGTDDTNVGATSPIVDPASQSRHGSHDAQRFVAAPETGIYVLAMTNADVFLSGPFECLDAPPGRPFTFTVTVAHGGGDHSKQEGGLRDRAGGERSGGAAVHRVAPGECLWVIAEDLVGAPAGSARVASEVARLWQLNAARIGTGDPDLIYAGLTLRLD